MKFLLSALVVCLVALIAIAPTCLLACDNQVSVGVGNGHCAVSQFASPTVFAYPAPTIFQAPPIVSYAAPQVFSSGVQYQQTVAVGNAVIVPFAGNSYSSFSRFSGGHGSNVNVFSSNGRGRRVGRANVNVRIRG